MTDVDRAEPCCRMPATGRPRYAGGFFAYMVENAPSSAGQPVDDGLRTPLHSRNPAAAPAEKRGRGGGGIASDSCCLGYIGRFMAVALGCGGVTYGVRAGDRGRRPGCRAGGRRVSQLGGMDVARRMG
jgi:hypothetical protein